MMQRGLSVIEVIIAASLFLIFSGGIVSVVLQGFDANRLGEEETIANQYAAEGIEAVRSIKNQAFSNLANSLGTGVTRSGANIWTLSGSANTLNKYTRVITIGDVQRDGNGNIVASGGTIDPLSKKITSTVSWNVSAARSNSVALSTYLSDWRKIIFNGEDGVIIYSDTTSVAQPRYRTYTNSTNTFSAESGTGSSFSDTVVGRYFSVQTNPAKDEAIAGYMNDSGVLRILCFDGTNWTSEWTVSVGESETDEGRFGIAFEKTSGDALVVYATGSESTNEMAYRTKPGSTSCGSANWSPATNINAQRTSGRVMWIRMEGSPLTGSNNISLVWADEDSDLSAMVWTGSSWGMEPSSALETNLERVSHDDQDVLSFDIAYESASGNLMIVWGLFQSSGCTAGATLSSTNCIRYARYTSSWSSAQVIPTVAAPATNIDISANPNTDELVLAALDDSQRELSVAYWSGSAWTGIPDIDESTEQARAGTKLIATGWLTAGSTTRSIIVYNDQGSTPLRWLVGNGSSFALQSEILNSPTMGNPEKWQDIQMDPKNRDRLIFTYNDINSDLFAKRLVMTSEPVFTWTHSDGEAALETTLGQATSSPYSFSYWKNP
ncbi:MAG: hypothetical protein HY431_01905 [Candidatus Levybacteria bacterium]|nr:hypothetical protein [Candidatus Levybacteria bacterium]